MPYRQLHPAILSVVLLFSACAGGIDGAYEPPNGEGFFERLTFHGGGTVDITFLGATKEAAWKRSGERLTISNTGETQVFTIDAAGCLDGGGLLGRYCRAGEGEGR